MKTAAQTLIPGMKHEVFNTMGFSNFDGAIRRAVINNKQFDLIDRYDDKHGISAMMRTTGFSLSITGQMQVRGQVTPPGVWTPDECMPAEAYIAELRKRGMDVRETGA